jgi:glycosyltransferase involved in cell wall biosynthesis
MDQPISDTDFSVLHILGPLRRSGAEMMLLQSLERFTRRGIRTTIVSLDGSVNSAMSDEFRRSDVEVHDLSSGSHLQMILGLQRIIRSELPDCVHVHAERASLLTMSLPRLNRVRVVRSVHNSFGFEGALRVRKKIERGLSRAIGVHFVAVSPSVQANEKARFSNGSTLILNWFDATRFRVPSAPERRGARQALGIGDEESVITVVGNCSEVKNHGLLLEAMACMPEQDRPLLLHAGDEGSDRAERDLAEDYGLSGCVRFLGTVIDLAPVLHASDLFVMPSLYEGLSIAAIEALGTGLRVIVTDVPGLRDLPKLNSGVSVVASDPNALADEIGQELGLVPKEHSKAEIASQAVAVFGDERGVDQFIAAYRGDVEP